MQRDVDHIRSVSRQQIHDVGASDIRTGSNRNWPCFERNVSIFFLRRQILLKLDRTARCRTFAYVWEVVLVINRVVSYGISFPLPCHRNMQIVRPCYLGLLVLRVWSISGRQIHVLLICASLVSATVALVLIVGA